MLRLSLGASRGTGFAIAPDRVLTSLHVVGKIVDGELRLHGESIRIAAAIAPGDDGSELREVVCVATRADIVDHDPELDWVAIRVDAEAFAGVTVPALGAMAASDQSASWSTYGFPDGNDRLGKATTGVVASTEAVVRLGSSMRAAIQVYSREASAASGGAVRGYSGAPVIVDGHVLGLLCAASEDAGGRSAEGTLYAIPLTPIARRLGLALRARAASSASPPPSTRPAPSPDAPGTASTGDASQVAASPEPRRRLYAGAIVAVGSVGAMAVGGAGGALIAFDWRNAGALLYIVGQLLCVFVLLAAREPFEAVRDLRLRLARVLPPLGITAVGLGATGLSAEVVEWLRGAGSLAEALRSPPWLATELGVLGAGLVAMVATARIRVQPAQVRRAPAAAPRAGLVDPATPPLPEVFHERVRMLFEKRAFTRFELATYDAAHGCLVGHSDDAVGQRRVVVRCDDRGAAIEDVDVSAVVAYAAALRLGDGARIYYVTPSRATNAAELASRFRDVELTSEPDLLDRLVHFDRYLTRVIEIYEKDPLPYSNTAEVKSLAATFVAPRFGLHGSAADPPRGSLRDYLDAWLADRHPRQIALLADYGMGKSSFLKHYAWHLARKRLSGEPGRIPILLSLTGRSPRNPPGADGLLQAFIDQYQLRCEVAAFRLLMRAGRLVFLIDAFDEMDLVGDRAMRLDHFAALWRLYTSGNKLLFAGRPTFFPDEAELNEAFRIADRGADRLAGGAYCERLSLAPLTDDDIAQSFTCYFEPVAARRHYEWVRGNPRLLDLARRPAMMHIIRDTIDDLRAQHAERATLREAELLELYTRHWIQREEDREQRRLLIGKDLRARFSEQLAAWMFETERRAVQSRELGELFAQWFPDDAARVASGAGAASRTGAPPLGRSHLLEGIETDLRNCTFLVRDPDEAYSFAHKPFFEYFVAASIDRCLRAQRRLPAVFQLARWGTEIALHVGDLWLMRRRGAIDHDDAARVFREITRAGMRATLRRMLGMWRELVFGARPGDASPEQRPAVQRGGRRRALWARLVGVSPLEPSYAYLSYMVRVLAPSRFNALQVLLRAGVEFEWIRGRFCSRLLAGVGDITHSDRCLPVLDLAGACLDGAKLRELDFSGRSLRGASFVRARIVGCRFDRADLTEARLERAQLQGVSLVGAVLRRARFDNAYIANCRFDRADAEEAVLEAANIQPDVSMRFLSLRRASLQGAVIEADLTGVDAIGASVANAFIDTSRAVRAKLPSDPPPAVELAPITLGTPQAIAWSPDDACLLVLSRGSAWLIDAGDGALIRRFQDPAAPIVAAAFRSSSEVIVASAAGTLGIEDLRTGTRREVRLGFTAAAIALSSTGVTFAAAALRGGGTYRVVFGHCDVPVSWPSVDIVAENVDIASIAVDDGATVVAILFRASPSPQPGTASSAVRARELERRVEMPDGSRLANAAPTGALAGICLVRRLGETVTVEPLGAGPRLAGAQALISADGQAFMLIEYNHAWRLALDGSPTGRMRDTRKRDAASFESFSRLVVRSPDGRWIDARDSGWTDAVPTQLAERMGVTEVRRPHVVHAHRDHEVVVAGPGTLAFVDSPGRLCRPFALGVDATHAATDPPRVIDDVRFLEDGQLMTAGLSTIRRWDVRALCEAASVQHGGWLATAIVLAADGSPVRGAVLLDGAEPRPEVREGRALCAGAHRVVLALEDPSTRRVHAIAVCDRVTGAYVVELSAADVELAVLGEGDRWLAFASGHQVTVVDLDTERSHSRALESLPTALAFFEGRSCVIGDAGGRLQSFGRLGAFAPHEDTIQISSSPITALAAAGSQFAIATSDGKIHTWSPGDAAPAQLADLPAATSRLSFSPDGALLAAATDDDIVRVFDLASRSLVARLYHLESGWAAVRTDGKYDHGGDVSRLSCVSGLRTYRLRDLDELIPGSRLPRPR